MSLVHTVGKSLYFIEGAISTSPRSFIQDPLLEQEKARREDKLSSSRLSTCLGTIQMKKHSDDLSPKKVYYHSNWKRTQDAVYWVNSARAQVHGLRFWQTRSDAIIVHNPLLADCIYGVNSQNGNRHVFRETPISTLSTCTKDNVLEYLTSVAAASAAAAATL